MNLFQSRIYRLFSVVLLITSLLSCSGGAIDLDMPEDNIPLEFNASVDWEVKSKSLINSPTDLQSQDISVLAKAEVGENVYSVFDNDMLYYGDGVWAYDAAKYWIPGAKYSFAAFAPFASDDATANTLSNGTVSFSSNNGNPVLEITGYNTVLNQSRTEDLLVAHYVRDNTFAKDYSAVPLEFKHLLSCVSFSIRNTTNSDITKVSNISLNGLQHLCDITLNTSSVTLEAKEGTGIINSSERNPEAGATAFLPKGMSEDDYKPLFDCEVLTLLPQTLYNKQIILNLTTHRANDSNGTVYSYNLGNIDAVREWRKGIKYNYSISITSTDILFQVSEVPWIEHDVEL